jgi:hypothetical protein
MELRHSPLYAPAKLIPLFSDAALARFPSPLRRAPVSESSAALQSEHRVRFAAAKVGLQLHNRVTEYLVPAVNRSQHVAVGQT